ncbi:carbohydrate ABC transporter permease [Leifsonia soli]|uniref:Multiple sugar transport system permease protein n=1 Tax=Leifsonia soli TaxID=582665 RepID=A0A852T2V2_9MICO|nr:sugar ABC transporter permease [Leifsonia soli]NYD75819.1 multiple sugar transport system permease protein [Leifsonia soli]
MTLSREGAGVATAPAPVAQAGPSVRPRRRSPSADGYWPVLFILPLFAGVALFYLWPLAQSAYYSFTQWGAFGGTTWIGLDNYIRLFSDPGVLRSILNTVIYTAILLLGIPLAVIFAALLNRPGLKFAMVYRTCFFLPYVAMPTAISMVWRIIYNQDYGVLNSALRVVGIEGPAWVSTEWFALIAVSIMGLWMSIGFNMIILSAGLKAIPTELYEATSLDGAGRWRQFVSITTPLLTPSIFFLSVMTLISGFQLFDLIYALLGPTNPVIPKTQSLVFMFYNAAFLTNDKGYASAIAMFVLVIIAVCTFLQFRLQRRWVHYVD